MEGFLADEKVCERGGEQIGSSQFFEPIEEVDGATGRGV